MFMLGARLDHAIKGQRGRAETTGGTMFFADKLGPVPKDAGANGLYHFLQTRLNGRDSFSRDELLELSDRYLQASGANMLDAQVVIDVLIKAKRIEKKGNKFILR